MTFVHTTADDSQSVVVCHQYIPTSLKRRWAGTFTQTVNS